MQSGQAASNASSGNGAHASLPDGVTALVAPLPSLLWVLLAALAVYYFRAHLRRIAEAVVVRLESGANVKVGPFELSAIRVKDDGRTALGSSVVSFQDNERALVRRRKYEKYSNFFIAHRLFPSEESGQTYDIWIYVVAHKSDLGDIGKVEYFFGEAWGNKVFVSSDRGKRFGVLASAYGSGFLCLARIHKASGGCIDTWRYVDFEQGDRGKD